jgi:multiple antibiotic resistance protein
MIRNFLWCFVPLFVAVDAFGVLPLFMSLTAELTAERRRRIVLQSVLTAGTVALAFTLVGRPGLRALGISVSDFMMAGGLLLFALSLRDLLSVEKEKSRVDLDTLGAVPIGVPLITGPAVLTTCMLLADQHGMVPTLAATVANILIAGVVFWFARPIGRALGDAGAKILSKMAALLLASIGVMMIRRGVMLVVDQAHGP